jgi:hypothetical protein
MKVSYLARWDARTETGVMKKILAQLEVWQNLGIDSRLFVLSPSQEIWGALASAPAEVVVGRGGLFRDRDLRRLLERVYEWKPDVAYVRYGTHYRSLERFMERVPTALELNTDDVGEYRLYLPWYKYRYHLHTRGRILQRAQGMVSVTHEIGRRFAPFGAPMVVIGNGIDLTHITPSPPSPEGHVRAIFIGSAVAPWHGVDKILAAAEQLPSWEFTVVGPSIVGRIPNNVAAYGHLAAAEYKALLERADVAIGTMALHRNGMDEACPLKVREYLAAGLPCIIGHEDTDFTPPPDFILQLSNCEANLREGLLRVEEFGRMWKGRRVSRERIQHLDIRAKEANRIAFLRSLV